MGPALRALLRAPGFTLATVLTLALGVGATTAIFTLLHAVVLRPLPYPDADRLVSVGHTVPGAGPAGAGVSDGAYLHYARHNRAFAEMGAYLENVVNLAGDEPERVEVALVTPSALSVLRARPALGRLLTPEDDRAGAAVVVIGHDLWRRKFGGDPGIVGRTVELNSAPKQVVGVMRPGFSFPRPETQVWYSLGLDPAGAGFEGSHLSVIGRLREGVTLEEARADLGRLMASLARESPDFAAALPREGASGPALLPLKERVVGDAGSALWILLGGVGFLLLIACANAANLVLIRAEHRRREVAVRAALGAGRGALARSFLAEAALLAGAGGALGVALADLGLSALVALGPESLPRLHEVRLGGGPLAFAAALSAGAALGLGAVALLHAGRPESFAWLREGARGATAGRERHRVRHLLVASQVALALTLLAGSALMVQSLWRLRAVDPGFDPRGVLTAEIALPFRPYPDYAAQMRLWNGVLEEVRRLPGMEAAGAVTALPLECCAAYQRSPVEAEGAAPREGGVPPAFHLVTPGYFEAMRIPVVAGRRPQAGDRADAGNPVYLSAALARRLFPGESPIGRRVRRADQPGRPWHTVAGVVGSTPDASVADPGAEAVYLPLLDRAAQAYPTHLSLAVRTTLPPASLAPALRRIVRSLDPDLPVARVRPMERIVADSTARTSFTMLLLLTAAAMALCLGAIGIYGVVSYAVGRRTREIGIRMALGAGAAEVRWAVLRQGAGAVAAGVGVGVLAALGVTRFLRALLYGVSPTDPLTLAGTALLLLGVALLAGYLPARRAARVDPVVALRAE